MILPLLLVMGGMSTWEAAARAVHVEIQSPDEEGAYELDTLHYEESWSGDFRERESGARVLDQQSLKRAGEVDHVDAAKRS
jgi:hypothetical protein